MDLAGGRPLLVPGLVQGEQAAVEGNVAQRREARLAIVTGNLRFMYLVEKVQLVFL